MPFSDLFKIHLLNLISNQAKKGKDTTRNNIYSYCTFIYLIAFQKPYLALIMAAAFKMSCYFLSKDPS